MYQRLQNWSQGSKYVNEYTEEFNKLLTRVDLSETEEQLVSRYIGGLRPQIQDTLNLFDPSKVSEAHQRALLIEKASARGSFNLFGRSGGGSYNRSRVPFTTREAPSQVTGPSKNPTPMGQPSRLGATTGPKCFRCGEMGHRLADCRKGEKYGKALLIDSGEAFDEQGDGEEQAANFDDYDGAEEEFATRDDTPLLMVRRICYTPWKVEGDDGQRHTLFHTICTVGGKGCKLVIDGGSCENVVAEEAVRKLGLATEKHPTPYRLEWLKKGDEVIMSKRCLVSFSIGKRYKDKVWCDVVAMDACHILLGRPWQYDRNAHHDGRKNTYNFLVDNVKLTLLPDPGECPKPSTGTGQTLLARHEFVKEMLEVDCGCLLVCKEGKKVEEVPEEAKGLVEEFADVFPVELPDELPPLRDIQHQIDLMLGSSLPNRPHYRLSPKEHEELRRQVEGLLAKGHIRESLSPCAVPALLTLKNDGSWRMCVDSRAINKITVRYRFPIPLLDDLLDQLSGATIFTKLDLRSGYHQIRLRPNDEWKTAFKTREGLFEWLVMPFGLSNAPSTFMRVMNQAFRPFIGRFVVVYFDDILIYSPNRETHLLHVREVLQVLQKEKFYASPAKCSFMTDSVLFLGYVVSKDGLAVDEAKVVAVQDWSIPTTLHEEVGIGAVLSQGGRPVAFFSEKLSGSRLNYSTYDVEFYALVQSLRHWSSYLAYNDFILYSDLEVLKHLNSQDKLSSRHANWAAYVQQFSFTINHKSGPLNKVADALSRKSTLLTTMANEVIGFDLLKDSLSTDPLFGPIVDEMLLGNWSDFGLHNGFLFKGTQLCIPEGSL
ncbi:uncharacterized protein LOC132174190 [Corylus avellana]|uniref:uncharacterized protein LOC132174190 n=1 Tax=Corylus avellana TaxID=13451 RepID=UPI00286CBF8F|nr:uncharacterized protein LOC132174190 [Corylus avellana]